MDMKLIQFIRVSSYGSYQICVDKGLDLRLCVCKNGFLLYELGIIVNRLFIENGNYMKVMELLIIMW